MASSVSRVLLTGTATTALVVSTSDFLLAKENKPVLSPANVHSSHPRFIKPIHGESGAVISPWEAPLREEHIEKSKQTDFDVLVIGGGATGSGCALDAQTRGLKTCVIERNDFGSGTSGRSTKLIHGGVRYLENAFKKLDYGSYKLVHEALDEREYMLSAAPYMNRPLPIMIPIYKWWEVPYMYIGTKVYDLVAGNKRFVPGSSFMSPSEAMYQYPNLQREGLKGAIVYYDGQMNDTRMNLAVALTAAQCGAATCNYVEATELLKDENGKIVGAKVRDVITGDEWQIKAKAVINATGPFTDGIRKMDDPNTPEIVVPAAGVHVVLPDHFSPERMGLIVPKTSDGRVLFFLPWENSTLAGTTDSETDVTMLPAPSKEEVDFIIEEANRYLAKSVRREDVKAAWSGIRPLVRDPKKMSKDGEQSTASISREHIVDVSDSNMITIAGGKWTTYRRMASDSVDKAVEIVKELQQVADPCVTRNVKLIGADRIGEVCNQKFDVITVTLREEYNMDKDVAEHLMRNYGTRALQIAEISKAGYLNVKPCLGSPKRLVSRFPFLEAEVVFATQQEYAVKAADVLARRTRLAFVDSEAARDVLPHVVSIMGDLLKWSKARRQQEIAECEEFLKTMEK